MALDLYSPCPCGSGKKFKWRCQPIHQQISKELSQDLQTLFGDTSRYPESARREYKFQTLPAEAPAARRSAWDKALTAAGTGKLADAVTAFAQLTTEEPNSAAAHYNLGLCRAW